MIRHWTVWLQVEFVSVAVSIIALGLSMLFSDFGLDLSTLDYLHWLWLVIAVLLLIWLIFDLFDSNVSLKCQFVAWKLHRDIIIPGSSNKKNLDAIQASRSLKHVNIFKKDSSVICKLQINYSDLLKKDIVDNHKLIHYLSDNFRGYRFNRVRSGQHSLLVIKGTND